MTTLFLPGFTSAGTHQFSDLLESDEADGAYTPVPKGQQPTKRYVQARVIPCYTKQTPTAPNPNES